MKAVKTAHAVLATLEQGAGRPVLFVHGFPFDHTMWRHQIDLAAQTARVIAPDLRGFGRSTIEPISAKTGVAMADYADDLACILDDLGVDEPVVLCGFSMGGYIAFQFFARHRAKLRALVLCDTKAAADSPQAREVRYKMAENVEGWGSAHVARLMNSKLYAASTMAKRPQIVVDMERVIAGTDPVAIAAAQRGMAHRDDSTPLISQLDLPTLFLVGEEDEITPPQEVAALAAAAPNSQYVVIPEAGHMSPVENPAAVNTALAEFLNSLR